MRAKQDVPNLPPGKSLVLVGMESVGKSALFNRMTSSERSEETNFRGSTVLCHIGEAFDRSFLLIDTPGIRVDADTETTRLAISACTSADTLLLVTRASYAREEVATLLEIPEISSQKMVILLTFSDREPKSEEEAKAISKFLGVDVIALNARYPKPETLLFLREAVKSAVPPKKNRQLTRLAKIENEAHTRSLKGNTFSIRLALLAVTLAIFALPVYGAFLFSGDMEGRFVLPLIDFAKTQLSHSLSGFWFDVILGQYGLLSLGVLSFLWAFPIVLLLGVSLAITDETGLKERITSGLDPWLRRFGLQGRDLLPVLSGFGCNVVAVYQTRACSRCNRTNCLSLITFGSACSYQIGSSLSVFSSYGRPGLFFPYLATVFGIGLLHSAIWSRKDRRVLQVVAHPTHLQLPSWRGIRYRLKSTITQFLFQAMPIFLAICAVGAMLSHFGILSKMASSVSPLLYFLRLPESVGSAVVFSILRKDGLLILNEGGGEVLRALTASQVFVTVYLSSTLTACLVTLFAIRRELGTKTSLSIAGKQLLTSITSAFVISILVGTL